MGGSSCMRQALLLSLLVLSQLTVAAESSACKALVVVGMADEKTAALGDQDISESVTVILGTANATRLRQRLNGLEASDYAAVFSFGVAGALDESLSSGTLLFSQQVITQIHDDQHGTLEVAMPVDSTLLASASLLATQASLNTQKGIFLGTDTEARDQNADSVTRLHEITGAHIIDNESHIAAQFARDHNLPFLSIRAVSDSVHHPLPPAALLPLDEEDGGPDAWAITKSLLMHPLQIPALIRTAREYGKAIDALENFQKKIGFERLVKAGGCNISA